VLQRPRALVAILLIALFVAALLVPFVGGAYAIKFTTRVLVLAIFVISLDFLIGITGLVSFGHAMFFGLGAYSLYFISPEAQAANALIAFPAAMLAAGVAAAIIGGMSWTGWLALLAVPYYALLALGVIDAPPTAPTTAANGQPLPSQAPAITNLPKLLILAVTPAQAEVMLFARTTGTLDVVLRSPLDAGITTVTTGVILKTLVDQYGILPPEIVQVPIPTPLKK